jgi:hypothetical protein
LFFFGFDFETKPKKTRFRLNFEAKLTVEVHWSDVFWITSAKKLKKVGFVFQKTRFRSENDPHHHQAYSKGLPPRFIQSIAATLPTRACCHTHVFQTFAEVDFIENVNTF